MILERRLWERDERLALARAFVQNLRSKLTIQTAFVAGAVARGDFNVWSDIDIVIVAAELHSQILDRSAMLAKLAPSGIQTIAYTPAEFQEALARRNPLVVDASVNGIVLT